MWSEAAQAPLCRPLLDEAEAEEAFGLGSGTKHSGDSPGSVAKSNLSAGTVSTRGSEEQGGSPRQTARGGSGPDAVPPTSEDVQTQKRANDAGD